VIAAGALLFTGGCGPGGSKLVVYPVSGAVTLNGAPVADAVVSFSPKTPVEGFAGAQTQADAQGHFDVVMTSVDGTAGQRGLPPGDYQVTVIKMQAAGGAASLTSPPKNVLPAKYATPEATPLTATVTADGENIVDLTL